MHLKISSAKWRPFCPGEDELICTQTLFLRTGSFSPVTWYFKYDHNTLKYGYIAVKTCAISKQKILKAAIVQRNLLPNFHVMNKPW